MIEYHWAYVLGKKEAIIEKAGYINEGLL